MNKLKILLCRHPLFAVLADLKGNPRICVLTEPLWGIPFNLYMPYMGIYMAALGLTDYKIGLIAMFGTFFQMFGALFGGIITDKLGRRRTTFLFDCISWSIPALIWMFAQNFWWFFAAIVFNSMWQVTDNAWSCLLVEDCEQKKLVDVYTWISVSGLLSVFFAPLSGLLMGYFDVVSAVRILFFITFLMMTTKFVILFTCCTETERGKQRLAETKHMSMLTMFKGYRHIFVTLWQNKATLMVLCLKILLSISGMVTGNFFGLYITRSLGISEQLVAFFPMARAAVMLLFIFTVQHKVNRMRYRPIMLAGAGMYLAANVVLVVATGASLWLLLVYVLLDAFSWALFIPRQDSLMTIFVSEEERARTLGLMFVITLAFTAPFGAIIGKLSEINMRLPFILNIGIYTCILLLVVSSRAIKAQDEKGHMQ